ncbi:MAG: helix-turn-helix domain-containing protein, partial [Actinomycetota bacterium]|nr:helix-turn-helix domain-containing protein [Actinomycetota bacterium]
RKEQGLSLQEVEQATKIRARYLKELEEGNFSVLPAVYVRGSLKTYADHLHLDGEALTQELKHQQASLDEPPAPAYDEPSKSDSARPLISASSPPKEGEGLTTTKGNEDVIPALLSADNRYYAYLGSAAFMILVLAAVAFALARGDDQSTASQEEAREPTASSAAAADDQEGEDAQQSLLQVSDEQSAEDEGDGSSLNEEAGLPDRGARDQEAARVGRTEQSQAALPLGGSAEGYREAGWVGQTGQNQNASAQAQASGNATPTSSTPASIEAAPATMEPSITPVQTRPATAASAASATAKVTVRERKEAAEAAASTRFSHTSHTRAPVAN